MSRPLFFAFPAPVLALAVSAAPQCNEGYWEAPFQHADPAGVWDTYPPPAPHPEFNGDAYFNALHMALIPKGVNQGKLLVWDWEHHNALTFQYRQRWSILDPVAKTFDNHLLELEDEGDPMCSGHAWTEDGDLFVAGGNYYSGENLTGNDLTWTYRPAEDGQDVGVWEDGPRMAARRWYPTVLRLGDGRFMVAGGGTVGHTDLLYEIYDPVSETFAFNLNPTSPFFLSKTFAGPGHPTLQIGPTPFSEYPRLHLLPHSGGPGSFGTVFISGYGSSSARVDPALDPEDWFFPQPPQGSWNNSEVPYRHDGTALLSPNFLHPVLENTVWRMGGHWHDHHEGHEEFHIEASVESCDAGSDTSRWHVQAPMNVARAYPNSVILADGLGMVVGGTHNVPGDQGPPDPILSAEILSPIHGWTTQPDMAGPRVYHATVMLLPSGKVLTAGGEFGALWDPEPGGRTWDYQVFVPPYIACGADRPTIVDAPDVIQYLDRQNPAAVRYKVYFQHTDNSKVSRVALAAPGAITHHYDMSTRYVDLLVHRTSSDEKGEYIEFYPPLPMGDDSVQLASHAPPGYYMLFIITDELGPTWAGVPSEAAWVKLDA